MTSSRTMPPPTHSFAGSNSERQSVGDPGHCEDCAVRGHVTAHPDLGCGDVGCTRGHGPDDEAAATPSGSGIGVGSTVRWVLGDDEPHDFGTVTAVVDGGYAVLWTGEYTAKFVPLDEVAAAAGAGPR